MIYRRYIRIFHEKNYSANLKNPGQKHTAVILLKQMWFKNKNKNNCAQFVLEQALTFIPGNLTIL